MDKRGKMAEAVHESGGRMTRQRRVVMDTLASLDCHPTARELHDLVRKELPGISQATVYRNLKVLRDLGYVQELDYGPGAARYDATVAEHCHARCTRCGRVVDVPVEVGEDVGAAEALADWEITGRRLELCGLCPECQDSEGSASQQEEAR